MQPRIPLEWLLAAASLICVMTPAVARAQNESGGADAGSCILRDHVYSCNRLAFQAALLSAKLVAVQAHNSDGVARNQLTTFLVQKLDKTIANEGNADLIFLIMPIDPSGVINGDSSTDLGTLRVYSSTSNGERGHLLWAETFSGTQDLPWPAVVHGLLMQFQSHFHIK